jgi:hypothetical protein
VSGNGDVPRVGTSMLTFIASAPTEKPRRCFVTVGYVLPSPWVCSFAV